MKKFRTSKTLWYVFGVMILIIEYLFLTANNPHVPITSLGFVSIASFFPLFIFSLLYGQYVFLNENSIVFVYFFVFKKTIPFKNIESISYAPNGQYGTITCSLFVVPKGKQTQDTIIQLPNSVFAEETIAAVAKALVSIDHSANVDSTVFDLIERNKIKRSLKTKTIESWTKYRAQNIGMLGAMLFMGIFLFSIYLKDRGIKFDDFTVFVFPTCILGMLFSIGYATTGKIKEAIWYLLPPLLFFIWAALKP